MKAKHLLLGAASALLISGSAFAGGSRKPVTVSILRVAQITNLDKGDWMKTDRADFYSLVKIGNGKLEKSVNHSDDDGHPGWVFYGHTTQRYVNIRIKLDDDDGGMEKKDDYVDINPRAGKKDLNLVLDTKTGRITGDVTGKRGQTLYSQGGGDSDKGKIWFKIS
jgi:hypothetical protein